MSKKKNKKNRFFYHIGMNAHDLHDALNSALKSFDISCRVVDKDHPVLFEFVDKS